jgi:hypothetical protein
VVLSGDLDDADDVQSRLLPVGHAKLQQGTIAEPARDHEPPRPVAFVP